VAATLIHRGAMRSQLRIADLKRDHNSASRALTFNVPSRVAEAIDQLAKKLGASKAAVVLALLNEGLDVAGKKRGGRREK
jgi:hypothetical protein